MADFTNEEFALLEVMFERSRKEIVALLEESPAFAAQAEQEILNWYNKVQYDYQFSDPSEVNKKKYGIGIRYRGERLFQFVNFKNNVPRWGQEYTIDNPLCELLIRKNLERFLYPHLTAPNRIVFSFILDRTFGWSKVNETIHKWHFIDGLYNINEGTGLSEPTINKALKALSESELIVITDGKPPSYQISLAGCSKFVTRLGKGILSRTEYLSAIKAAKKRSKKKADKGK